MLEKRIHKRILNSVFLVSVKTTLFAVLSEKLPLFYVLPILISLSNGCYCPITTWKTDPFLQNLRSSYPKRWQRCPALKKVPFSSFVLLVQALVRSRVASALPGRVSFQQPTFNSNKNYVYVHLHCDVTGASSVMWQYLGNQSKRRTDDTHSSDMITKFAISF